MNKNPNNTNTENNPVGRFMVAAGGVLELDHTGKILLVKRSSTLDWHPGEWEITYGRLAQFEDVEMGLRREIGEELGCTDISVGTVLRIWHIFRGERAPESELIGITYSCKTQTETVRLSDEHSEFAWVTPDQALTMVTVEGIKEDIRAYQNCNAH
jgi:8-oxo-dGTP pyrophosphatase MutT (NUDIX family)